jgi:hypothetical protein
MSEPSVLNDAFVAVENAPIRAAALPLTLEAGATTRRMRSRASRLGRNASASEARRSFIQETPRRDAIGVPKRNGIALVLISG